MQLSEKPKLTKHTYHWKYLNTFKTYNEMGSWLSCNLPQNDEDYEKLARYAMPTAVLIKLQDLQNIMQYWYLHALTIVRLNVEHPSRILFPIYQSTLHHFPTRLLPL
jgi:hypothetical protein